MSKLLESLSKFEKEILIAEQGKGIYKRKTDQTVDFVDAGGGDFYFENDPNTTKIYTEALDRLIRKGLVTYEGGELFILTDEGKQISEKLYEKIKTSEKTS